MSFPTFNSQEHNLMQSDQPDLLANELEELQHVGYEGPEEAWSYRALLQING
jgi:hypothetical protein